MINGVNGFWLALVAMAVLLFLGMLSLLRMRYKRCPANRILVVYGWPNRGQAAKCIHGGAKFVLPLVQEYAYLTLEPIQIEVPLRAALSMENIRVNVPSVFTVAIGTSPDLMQNAAVRLLGLEIAEIKKQAEDMIFGQLRQVIASMKIEDINRDRDKFLESIQISLEPELKKIGLLLINVNITDITDESGYIEAIGRNAASQAIQQARGDVAEQERIGETRVAEAERDQQIQVAQATKEREIGTREAERERAVRVAELEKDQKIGEQRAAFERESQVKEDERAMRIQVASADATAIVGENESKANIAASEATLQVKRAEAYALGEKRKREAEAEVLEVQNRAMAKAAIADAERVEAERRAALEAPAKAEKARVLVEAEAEAGKRRLEAEGEASAIFARLEAEAKGQYEILAKKAEGLRMIVDACGSSEAAFQLMMLEHLDNLADASARAISNIKFDKVVVWENGGQGGQSATAGFLQNIARSLPPMLQVMKDIGGIEIPETLARFGEEPASPAPAPKASDSKGGSDDGEGAPVVGSPAL